MFLLGAILNDATCLNISVDQCINLKFVDSPRISVSECGICLGWRRWVNQCDVARTESIVWRHEECSSLWHIINRVTTPGMLLSVIHRRACPWHDPVLWLWFRLVCPSVVFRLLGVRDSIYNWVDFTQFANKYLTCKWNNVICVYSVRLLVCLMCA